MPTPPLKALAEADKAARQLEAIYVATIRGVARKKILAEIEKARWEIEALAKLLYISAEDMDAFNEALRATYRRAGTLEAPRGVGFAMSTQVTTEWLAKRSSTLITLINEQQMLAVREVLAAAARLGRNPRQTALDIVGRISQGTGRRMGGIIGLNGPHGAAVATARIELATGTPESLAAYMTRKRRDRRFDGAIERAIAGETLKSATIDRIIGRYADRLLLLRGETVGRTESLAAANRARTAAWGPLIESGQPVQKEWIATHDKRTRDQHLAMDGIRVPLDQPFKMPDGSLMMHPGDDSLGAGAGQIINCRCVTSMFLK